jgi:glutamate-1-semialdehyde 2,1-aminomutase
MSREPTLAPTNFTEAKLLCENGLYGPFFHAMLERGVALAPGAYEILFTSMAHSDDDFARTIDAAREAAQIAMDS